MLESLVQYWLFKSYLSLSYYTHSRMCWCPCVERVWVALIFKWVISWRGYLALSFLNYYTGYNIKKVIRLYQIQLKKEKSLIRMRYTHMREKKYLIWLSDACMKFSFLYFLNSLYNCVSIVKIKIKSYTVVAQPYE